MALTHSDAKKPNCKLTTDSHLKESISSALEKADLTKRLQQFNQASEKLDEYGLFRLHRDYINPVGDWESTVKLGNYRIYNTNPTITRVLPNRSIKIGHWVWLPIFESQSQAGDQLELFALYGSFLMKADDVPAIVKLSNGNIELWQKSNEKSETPTQDP